MTTGAPLVVGILETGVPPANLAHFGSYPAMIEALLGDGFSYQTFDAVRGDVPADPAAYAALVITGSSAGVYDDLPWIAPLIAFLQAARGRTKLVGICFGHQIMAAAFGGTVVKSDKGWGLGLHDYTITDRATWMDGGDAVAVAVSHQDQVVTAPPAARVRGGSPFTPNGILDYPDDDAISFQCHPEFEPAFAAGLVELKRGRLPDTLDADALVASLARPSDRRRVGQWIRTFIAGPVSA